MANLDEKFLDGPNVGYCSDSEDEEPSAFKTVDGDHDACEGQGTASRGLLSTAQTGPKGVLSDYRLHQQQERVKAKESEAALLKEMRRMAVSPPTATPETDDNELERIRRLRMENLRQMRRGRIMEVADKSDFLRILDTTDENTLVFMHIYRDGLEACELLNEALLVVTTRISNANFYKVKATILDTTRKFELNALPALQIYKGGNLVGNFIRVDNELGDDFGAVEIIKLLAQNDIPVVQVGADARTD